MALFRDQAYDIVLDDLRSQLALVDRAIAAIEAIHVPDHATLPADAISTSVLGDAVREEG